MFKSEVFGVRLGGVFVRVWFFFRCGVVSYYVVILRSYFFVFKVRIFITFYIIVLFEYTGYGDRLISGLEILGFRLFFLEFVYN